MPIIKTSKSLIILLTVSAVTAWFIGLTPGYVLAYSLATPDSITMTSSMPSAVNVSYAVSFTAATTATLQGIIVDFCSNSPTLGDVCDAPAGFSVGTPIVTNEAGITSSWSASSLDSDRTVLMTYPTGTAITSGENISFNVTTVTNPSAANTTYYARILTYTSSTVASAYSVSSTSSSIGDPTDAGGVALSTSNSISVNFVIPESLSFCVYTGANCAAGGNSITLGDSHGYLSVSGPFVDKSVKYDISTNASHGAVVDLQGNTLRYGAQSIPALSTPTASVAGTSQFGVCTYTSAGIGCGIKGIQPGVQTTGCRRVSH